MFQNTYNEAMSSKYASFWVDAIKEEMSSHYKKDVFKVDRKSIDNSTNIIDTRLVFAIKSDVNGIVTRFKARLVARGFTPMKYKDCHGTHQ